MKNRITIFSLCAFAFILLTNADSCTPTPTTQDIEQSKVEENQKRLMTETDIPILHSSLDRKQISKRLVMFEDENKVSYIYLISFGKVMAFYPVKGKVTSGSKRLTTNEKLERGDGGEYSCDFVMESPSLDGTYGTSDSYIFFWTTDGTYIQWNDAYLLCDRPLKITTQPELIYDVTPKK
jgi:hypothetical protein